MNSRDRNCITLKEFPQDFKTRFEKLEKIEEGAYGNIYTLRNVETGQLFSSRTNSKAFDENGISKEVLHEIVSLMKLDHENIIRMETISLSAEQVILVYEHYMTTLHDIIYNQVGCDDFHKKAQSFLKQICEGLNHCHMRGIRHGDLNSYNIVLAKDFSTLKITRFAACRRLGVADGSIVNKAYQAPEALSKCGKMCGYTCEMDMWSVGCVIAEFLLGELPFMIDDSTESVIAIFRTLGAPESFQDCNYLLVEHKRLLQVEHLNGEIFRQKLHSLLNSKGMDLLMKLLHYNPSKRPTSKRALAHLYFNEEECME